MLRRHDAVVGKLLIGRQQKFNSLLFNDSSKALGRGNHKKISNKLQKMDIPRKLLNMLRYILGNSFASVEVRKLQLVSWRITIGV